MKTFLHCLIISSLLINFLNGFSQKCKVNITGTGCVGDSLTAHFKGGTLSNLVWLWSDENNSERPIYYSSVETVAGGNGEGSAANKLNSPTSVYVDANGNIYVADADNNRIQKWAPGATSGVTVAGGNGEGSAANQFSSPKGVFVDASGNIYIADASNNRIQKWAPGGAKGKTVAGGNGAGSNANQLHYPTGVFVDANKNIYIADLLNNRIQKWAPNSTNGVTAAGGNGYGSAANQLANPKSIYVDVQKNIYIADYSNYRIQKWERGATSGITVAGGNGKGSADNQLQYPSGVYVDKTGSIFIADSYNVFGNFYYGSIKKWLPGATEGTTIGLGDFLFNPHGIFVDVAGNIYVVDKQTNLVKKYLSQVTNSKFLPKDSIGYYGAGSYRVIATSTDGCIDTSNGIKVFIPAKISGIKGKTTDLCGGGNFQYTVEFNFFMQHGIYDTNGIVINWLVPRGCTIVSGQGTTSILLKIPADFVKGNLKVIGNLCNTADTFVTEISTKPYISPINGFAYVKPEERNLIYSVESDSNLYYIWSVPNDATIVSGQGTSRIKVSWGESKGNVVVKSVTCADTAIRKLHVVFIDSAHHPVSRCGKDSLKKSFKGKAPWPWAIDGTTRDWETLLGPKTGDNYFPYYPPGTSDFNWAIDVLPFNDVDYDYPEKPENDIRFTAFMHDDYNAYFYLRRTMNGDSTKTFLYFCDVNSDGYMNYGEPVFHASFSNNTISALTLSKYVPDTTKFYRKGKGNLMVGPEYESDSTCGNSPQPHFCYQAGQVSAFPMRGTLKTIFQSNAIPDSNKLTRNEIFAAAVTENGYGVELAIPWKYLKSWRKDSHYYKPLNPGDIFFYRESLQPVAGQYIPDSVKDNAGSCCASVAKSGNVNVSKSVSVEELIPDSLYRFRLSYTNTTNAAEAIQLESVLYNQNYLGGTGLTNSTSNIPSLRAIHPDYNCNGIVDSGEKAVPLHFTLKPTIIIPGNATSCINVDITSPFHHHPPEGTFTFESSVLFNIHLEPCDAAGGKVINPVGTVKTKIGKKGIASQFSEDSIIISALNKVDVSVYPNPNNGNFTVYLSSNEINSIIVYDVYGKIIKQLPETDSNRIEINNLKNGFYFLKVTFKNGKSVTKKVIVE